VLVSQYNLAAENIQILYADGGRSTRNSNLFQEVRGVLAKFSSRDRVSVLQELFEEYFSIDLNQQDAQSLVDIFLVPGFNKSDYSPEKSEELSDFALKFNQKYPNSISISSAYRQNDKGRYLVYWSVLASSDMSFAKGSPLGREMLKG
jgi:hypothetical protein